MSGLPIPLDIIFFVLVALVLVGGSLLCSVDASGWKPS